MSSYMFTSESVTEGHPDKLCDQIADSVLDAIIAEDPTARVACESITTTGMALIMGEITTKCYADFPGIVRNTIREAGYNHPEYGFDGDGCAIISSIDEQSPDIALGVDNSLEYKASNDDDADHIGAGDQGIMFGFACDETPELMPAPISYAHKLCMRLAETRKLGELSWLRPDGKSQVTVQYGEGCKIERIEAIVLSTQHDPDIELKDIRDAMMEMVIKKVMPAELIDKDTKIYINPTGRFVYGGPRADSGLTGRKIIVDTYGGYARHGGGSFSGKDPTKVDRSASYMARHVAKNIVAAGLARHCEIELGYAIGVAHPVSVFIDTFGTGVIPDEKLLALVKECFDFRPAKIISYLDLRRPIYKKTAAYGHFGRSYPDFTWEDTSRAAELKDKA